MSFGHITAQQLEDSSNSLALLPSFLVGGRDDPINEKGIAHYSKMIDRLLAKGITPYVTIWHWCTPLALQKKYGGFTNAEEISKDITRYADVLFERLGDRVTNWITLNEVS